MNEFKGTPGPWSLNRHGAIVGGKFHEYSNGSAQSQVAMVVGSREVNEQEMKANAALIAAAPDLLEALQSASLTLHTGSMFVDGACKCSQCEFVYKARFAIAKATSISN